MFTVAAFDMYARNSFRFGDSMSDSFHDIVNVTDYAFTHTNIFGGSVTDNR